MGAGRAAICELGDLGGAVVSADALHDNRASANVLAANGESFLKVKAHGRTVTRRVDVYPFTPWESGLQSSQSLIVVTRSSIRNKTGAASPPETQYGVSSESPCTRTPLQWLALELGHWRGVEARNHNRRDVSLNEDRIRSKNVNICASLALLCGSALFMCASAAPYNSVPEIRQYLAANPRKAVSLATHSKPKLRLPHAKPKHYLQTTIEETLEVDRQPRKTSCA